MEQLIGLLYMYMNLYAAGLGSVNGITVSGVSGKGEIGFCNRSMSQKTNKIKATLARIPVGLEFSIASSQSFSSDNKKGR